MSVSDVFPIDPSFPVELNYKQKVLIEDYDSGVEQRKLKWANPLRLWTLKAEALTQSEYDSLKDFWLARKGAFDVFSFLPPKNQDRLVKAISVGTGDGVTTQFTISGGGSAYYYRVYTGSGNRNQAYAAGSPVSATFANNDSGKSSTVTYAVAPANGVALTVDTDRYIICRFMDGNIKMSLLAFSVFDSEFGFMEVFRNSI